MQALVISCQAHAGRLDDVVSVWRDKALPALRHEHGLEQGLVLTDSDTGMVMVVILAGAISDGNGRANGAGEEPFPVLIDPDLRRLVAGAMIQEVFQVSAKL